MLRAMLLFCATFVVTAAHAQIVNLTADGGLSRSGPAVDVRKDFARDFDASYVENSTAASASLTEKSAGVTFPGIFLHPGSGDAVLRYEQVAIPSADALPRIPFLLFRIGFRDGVPWNDPSDPDGVRFSIRIDGETVFQEDHKGDGWQARAVDLSPWRGRRVAVEFRTNAIDRSNYDWAVFAQPLLVTLPADGDMAEVPAEVNGVALAHIQCDAPARVAVRSGDVTERVALSAGSHWVPVHFDRPVPVELVVDEGRAELASVTAGAHAPRVENVDFALSTPLIIAGEPFNALLTVRNSGLGTYTGGGRAVLPIRPAGPASALTVPGGEEQDLGTIRPGEEKTLVWRDIVAGEPGAIAVNERQVPVMPAPPELPGEHATNPRVRVTEGDGDAARLLAVVENGHSRVCIVGDRAEAYGIAETWNGQEWQRLATLYPLASLVTLGADKQQLHAEPKDLRVEAGEDGDSLRIQFAFAEEDGRTAARAAVVLSPRDDSPSIDVNASLTADDSLQVAAFYGPVVLAGDRSFGVEKDFAIFPGLEYLEGHEPSSSTRDLAYPLSVRRVPAAHKIATPLTAVQARGGLVALMWDANQEWAPGEQHPAARFLAPAFDSGYGHIHMSIFAPSVGEYVKENAYAAERPYAMKAGDTLRLRSALVLDHASRYPADSIVRGPHKGGLALQAMAHYFDAFGLPEPSELPRPWDDVRALSRHAYHETVWNEDPPGWGHCHGWDPQLAVSFAVPMLVDIEAGVSEKAREESLRRIEAVFNRALEERGPEYFWSNVACHTLFGELPFYAGYMPEALADMRRAAEARLRERENGLWVWRPSSEKTAELGLVGDHTLSQAAYPSFILLRTARLTGDHELMNRSLEAMKQMEQYEVPRGAQTWECPLYQPDILAAAQAIRAYTEAYRLTGDAKHLDHARYWAWTGLPFLYTWEMEGYPTMRYNVISVIGSTHYTHSWLGLPVVWCGLVYAYALQDLAEFDNSFRWNQIAEGITNSAIWQQYPDGPSKGCYPDSWNMVSNRPNPADINPENLLLNAFRLRGLSPEPRYVRLESPHGPVFLNAAGDITEVDGSAEERRVAFTLAGRGGIASYALLSPVPRPQTVEGAGEAAADSVALTRAESGWLYSPELGGVVIKHSGQGPVEIRMRW